MILFIIQEQSEIIKRPNGHMNFLIIVVSIECKYNFWVSGDNMRNQIFT